MNYKYVWLFATICTTLISRSINAQLPRSLHPNITIEKLMNTQVRGVRLAYDATTQTMFYNAFTGDIFRIEQPTGGQAYDVPIGSWLDHGINYLQGMAFANGVMILAGNFKQSGQQGYGLVVKGIRQSNGSWRWERIMQTDPYPSSATLYDHAFSAVCVTPNKDSVYISSGSRTDHGEIEDTDGLYPNTREVPLTATIFKLPINPASTIHLPNEVNALNQSGYVFCQGVRNEFDLALDAQGRLFGVENSGDRDDPEEMNWLRKGHHYGFPWEMGGNQTPQQFPGYNPSQDKLLPASLSPDQQQKFYNDPTFPTRPAGLVVTQPIRNVGPDANFARDPNTGQVVKANSLSTFTSHRSPLGLIFDTDNSLADFTGDAFTLSYSAGGGVRGGYLFAEEPGEDLLHIRLQYDPATDNYTAQTTKIADNFIAPTDAERIGNIFYVIEEGRQAIWKLTFKPRPTALADLSLSLKASDLVATINQPLTLTLTVQNDGPSQAEQIQLENRLPPSMIYAGGALTNTNNVLTKTIASLSKGQSVNLVYQLIPLQSGVFQNDAQLLASNTPDPDSEPGSGTADGQDDAARVVVRTRDAGSAVFVSPNPNQRPLPAVTSNQPSPDPTKADLSLQLIASNLAPTVGDLVSFTVLVSNAGGQPVSSVTVGHTLPAQMTFETGTGWTANGLTLTNQIGSITAGGQAVATFVARVTSSGQLLNQAQITQATQADPDSTPNNGYTNGEDDTARIELRVR
ncbi:PQQ-dependent sugar dehydrogenase [Spirosoma oryzicola]|uniref:PQQ-dependent sugar dehydrogenase n=1 Tax=Spirosoma oryzicola TaxID=2898794 RepID=UPI001E2AAAD7|nr:PQQ-dependent sugar dehydrogenase [Spirosoma oryzicola]UHG89669.1 DUF11 domain-containing protein [Spirosoma oryzicola]